MTHTKNNIPICEEQQIINEEKTNIQEILNQFKQPISDKFIKLKVEEGNYMGSTNPKWKDKPNYERYGFYLEEEEEKWVQIDIPRELVKRLEIEKGDDIAYPIYLTIDISQKKLVRGAYTIDNEEEVFIDKPISEKNVEKELVKRLKELEILREQVKKFENLRHEKEELEEKSKDLEKKVKEEQEKNNRLDKQILRGIKVKEELQKELQELKNESKRSWKDFYDWLQNNITKDRRVNVEILEMKNGLEKDYPNLSRKGGKWQQEFSSPYGVFLEIVRRLFAYSSSKYTNYPEITNDYFEPYDDVKPFPQRLINWMGSTYEEEIKSLLGKYRQETL